MGYNCAEPIEKHMTFRPEDFKSSLNDSHDALKMCSVMSKSTSPWKGLYNLIFKGD